MLFSSPVFFVFFVLYFGAHLATPRKYRIWLIIAGSTIFYAWWKIEYIWLPYTLMAIAYLGGRWISQGTDTGRLNRKCRATIAIVTLLTPLAIVKYTDFVYRD